MFKKILYASVIVSTLLTMATPALADEFVNNERPKSVTVQLGTQNGSGESGTATLTASGDKTTVVLTLTGAPATEQPAHIHLGSCASLGEVKYTLASPVNGASTTTLNVSLSSLLNRLPLAINVHKSASEIGTYVACGDLAKPVTKTLDVACVQTTIDTRDTAVIAAFDAYHDAGKTALMARKDALKAAWAITDKRARNVALNAAWKTYNETIRKARKDMNTARQAAWRKFNADRKNCGRNAASIDGEHQGSDASL